MHLTTCEVCEWSYTCQFIIEYMVTHGHINKENLGWVRLG